MRDTHTKLVAGKSDWDKVDRMSGADLDAAILDDPDEGAAHLSLAWTNAVIGIPARKEMVNMRLDPDILAWFRAQGRGYQTRINAVLRAFVEAKSGG